MTIARMSMRRENRIKDTFVLSKRQVGIIFDWILGSAKNFLFNKAIGGM